MAEIASEQEQLEQLKSWWNKYWWQTLLAITLVCTSYLGLNFWQSYQQQQFEQGASLFTQILELDAKLTSNNPLEGLDAEQKLVVVQQLAADKQQLLELGKTIINQHTQLFYASLAQLLVAKHALLGNQTEQAANALQWIIDNQQEEEINTIARLRLAKVLWLQNKIDTALTLLDNPVPNSFIAAKAELQGDLHLANKQIDKARSAYTQAMTIPNDNAPTNPALARKLNDLALPTPNTSNNLPANLPTNPSTNTDSQKSNKE